MQVLRQTLAIVLVTSLAWTSIVDNAAICPDEVGQGQPRDHDTPAGSHCCLMAPCHTPTASPSVFVIATPSAPILTPVAVSVAVPESAEQPSPPTPPPTSLDPAV